MISFGPFPPKLLDNLILEEACKVSDIGLWSKELPKQFRLPCRLGFEISNELFHAGILLLLVVIGLWFPLLVNIERFLNQKYENELMLLKLILFDTVKLLVELLSFSAQSICIPVIIPFCVLKLKLIKDGSSEWSQDSLVDGIWLKSATLNFFSFCVFRFKPDAINKRVMWSYRGSIFDLLKVQYLALLL